MAGMTDWLLGQRAFRVGLVALLFPLPLLAIVSAAIVVLTAGARGWRVATADALLAAALLATLTAAAGGYWVGMGAGALATWGVATGLGHARKAGSLNLAVQIGVLLALAAALAFQVLSRDPQAYWEDVLRDLAERAQSAGFELAPAELMPVAARVMTGMMAASALASALGALFLGAWWLGDSGGRPFGAEFAEVRMGRIIGLIAGCIALLGLTGLSETLDDLLLVAGLGFVVQGLAVLHWHGRRRNWPRGWVLALYLPLALVPALAAVELLLLAAVGLVDNGYRLRRLGGKLV